MREKVDYFFNKLLPKKFIVWAIATILVFWQKLPAEYWFYISIAYIGGNVLSKFSGLLPSKKEM